MSGFITTLFYPPKKQQQFKSQMAFATVFWSRRLARIYPVVILSLAISVPTVCLYGARSSPDPLKGRVELPVYVIGELAKQLTFTEQILPRIPLSVSDEWQYWPASMSTGMGIAPAAMTINGPLWTLGAQGIFWASFPWLSGVVHVQRASSKCIRVVLALWLLYVALNVTLTWLLAIVWAKGIPAPLADHVLALTCTCMEVEPQEP